MKTNQILKRASLFCALAQDSLNECEKIDYHIDRLKSQLRDIGLEMDVLLHPDLPLINDLDDSITKGTTWKTKLWSSIQPSGPLDVNTKLTKEQKDILTQEGNTLMDKRNKLLKTLRHLESLKQRYCPIN